MYGSVFLISEGARIRAAHFTGVIKDQALQVPLKRRSELAEGSPGKLPADLTIIARFATKGIG
ncbi:MAG: hypothetical protein SFV81_20245 [Pirellulaceae bacterium]|nr:hypothetical protein [Pirellulaceae bacterium]